MPSHSPPENANNSINSPAFTEKIEFPPPEAPVSEKENTKKKLIIAFVVIIVWTVLLAVIIIGQKVINKTKSTVPMITSSPEAMMEEEDETADGETYTSNGLGASFKYPPDWKLYENDTEHTSISICNIDSGSRFEFIDGACLSFSASDSMEIDLEEVSEYEVSEFGFEGWEGKGYLLFRFT